MNLSNARSNEELKANRAKVFQQILDDTDRDHGLSNHDHIDEATNHLIDHFTPGAPKEGAPGGSDFVVIMGCGLVGKSRETGKDQAITSLFMRGDMDNAAHYLANVMRHDPAVAGLIFHALHAYHHGL